MSDSATRNAADEEWEKLLRQWRDQQHAQPRPFFYSRVRARLAAEDARRPQLLHSWLRWPGYAVMLLIVLLLSGDGALPRAAESASHPRLYAPAE